MGGLSLTNPGLVYDQGQGVDPTSGMQVQLPPIVKFFKNAALRGHQAALDEMSTVQPSTGDIHGPSVDATGKFVGGIDQTGKATGGPVSIPVPGQADTNQITQNPATSSMPRMFQPSFAQTTRDQNGMPLQVNPAETKLGKLVHILAAAGQGALAGWGQGNPGAGAAMAREVPFQQAQQRQALQAGSIENQQRAANLKAFPLDIAQKQAAIQATLQQIESEKAQTGLATGGVHSSVWEADPNNPGGMVQQGYDAYGRPVGGAIPAIPPYMLKPKIHPVNYVGDDGQPHPGTQNLITGEVMSQDGSLVPNARVFEGSLVPKSSTTSSSSSTDLMGNTTERNQRVTAPVMSPGGGAMGAPPQGGRAPVNMVQRTAGGPLAPQRAPNGPVQVPAGTLGTAAAPHPAKMPAPTAATLQLAPDVEQRLAGSSLNPQEQQYVRGLLNYQGQMPSPRAKNYAATLATLTSIDPNFNAANYDANRKTLEDYTPGGSVGKQAIAFNTAIAHLDMLSRAADALKSNDVQGVNRIAQFFKVQTGNSAVTTFNNIADAVDGEVSKTFKGTATEGELSRVGAHFAAALGPDQIKNNIGSTIGLLNGKMGEMQSAFQRQIGRPINMVSPEAQQAIQRMSGGGGGQITFRDSRGGTHQISQQAWQANQAAIRQRDPGVQLIQ
jgi:hypothetical protein